MTGPANVTQKPFLQNYQDMRQNGIDQKELVQLSKQAVADHKLDAQEVGVFQEIYQSHLETKGNFSTAELMELPPQVQNLFQEMNLARHPEAPKPVSAFSLLSDGPQSLQDPKLSPARVEMRNQLDKVITTSRWGYAPTKEEQDAGKRNLFDKTGAMSKGTTCGLLPGSMLSHMGIQQAAISGNATNGIETEGKRLGVWTDSDGSVYPKPGDVYALRYEDDPNAANRVAHVGVVYATGDKQWTTADAGQGSQDKQEAGLVQRNLIFDAKNRPYLSGPDNVPGDSAAYRRIAGWVDTDKLMFLQSYQDKLLGTAKTPGAAANARGIDGEDLRSLATIAMRDGSLNETEKKVFTEIAHHREGLTDADIQSLPKEIQEIFQQAANQPAPRLIPLPGDIPDNADHPKSWRRRSSAIAGTGSAADHS